MNEKTNTSNNSCRNWVDYDTSIICNGDSAIWYGVGGNIKPESNDGFARRFSSHQFTWNNNWIYCQTLKTRVLERNVLRLLVYIFQS